MHSSCYDVLYSQFSHQHVSAAITVIFRVILLLLQEYKGTNVSSCVAFFFDVHVTVHRDKFPCTKF
jgi:uncharacterized membrane protein